MDSHERLHEHINEFMEVQNQTNEHLRKAIDSVAETQKKIVEVFEIIPRIWLKDKESEIPA